MEAERQATVEARSKANELEQQLKVEHQAFKEQLAEVKAAQQH